MFYSDISDYLIKIISLIIILSLLMFFFPNGKTKKIINIIFSLIFIIYLFNPLIKNFDLNYFNGEYTPTAKYSEEYSVYMENIRETNIKTNIENIAKDLKIDLANIKVIQKNNDLSKIEVYLYKDDIIKKQGHIFIIEDLINKISENLNIEKEMIEIVYV